MRKERGSVPLFCPVWLSSSGNATSHRNITYSERTDIQLDISFILSSYDTKKRFRSYILRKEKVGGGWKMKDELIERTIFLKEKASDRKMS